MSCAVKLCYKIRQSFEAMAAVLWGPIVRVCISTVPLQMCDFGHYQKQLQAFSVYELEYQ